VTAGGRAAGEHWESVAAQYLRERGLVIVARGYRCRMGELDIVCMDGDELVVVEVRARSRTAYADALGSIGHAKRSRILNATRHYLMRHPEAYGSAVRFDVVAIDGIGAAQPTINWVRNAFFDA
jgi:putative endonuclease